LAQITLGGLDVNPVNSSERFMAIFCNLFGLLFGGTLVSVLATTMIELRETNQDREQKLRKLREFLLQHGVGIDVRLRVVHQVRERTRANLSTLVEKDVEALRILPPGLLRDLRYDLFYHNVLKHPLLHAWTLLAEDSLRHLCSHGATLVVLLPDDELFPAGVTSTSAYFLREGSLSYTLSPAEGVVEEEEEEVLAGGTWISEATWWCHWYHVGTACATKQCTLLALPADRVLASMGKDPFITAVTLEYGIRFHQYIVGKTDKPVTDVNVQYADFNGVLCSMPTEVHVILGKAALRHALASGHQKWLEKTTNVMALEKEIQEGRSLVMLDQDDHLHRKVAVTVLQVENENCQWLVQIAHYDRQSNRWVPQVRLPGVKQRTGQAASDTLQKIIDTRLPQLKGLLTPSEMRTTMENSPSRHFGIGTTYVKTACVVPAYPVMQDQLEKYARQVGVRPVVTREMSYDSSAVAKLGTFLHDNDKIEQVRVVYVLGGFQHCGVYAWMSVDDFQKLKRNDMLLSNMVATVLRSLGELAPLDDFAERVHVKAALGLGSEHNSDYTSWELPIDRAVPYAETAEMQTSILTNPPDVIHATRGYIRFPCGDGGAVLS